ncbi:MAG: hypothetical protein Q8P27_03325, partial [Candidatus Peregrinibacteria bacterium]|nr:hypothetical protein [Candidatus Peregrinibacteria bacterium]
QEKKYHFELHKHHLKEIMLTLGFPINILLRSMAITERKNAERILEESKPEILIHPDVTNYSLLDFKNYHEIYEKGLEAGEEWLEKIKGLMSIAPINRSL